MTIEEVAALGDEELSRLCAEKVMGWKEERGLWWGENGEKWIGQLSRDEDWSGGEERWNPAANLNDAWVLVAEMEKRGGLTWAMFCFWYALIGAHGGGVRVAHGICFAALRAVGVIGEEPEPCPHGNVIAEGEDGPCGCRAI